MPGPLLLTVHPGPLSCQMAIDQPVLTTDRLILRPYALDDAPELAFRLNNPKIYQTTLALPYPYEEHHAVEWISTHRSSLDKGTDVNFVVTLNTDRTIIGAVSLNGINERHRRAEIGYWIASDYWNQGYATEACQAVLDYGFRRLNLHRIQARHFRSNPASGRVIQKLGMQREGISRHAAFRAGKWHDLVNYAILETDPRA
jgi:ribosomal-protein-alanine N-acetyltransferase